MMTGKDYYQILGVDEKATPDEIKKAFRRLATKFHPDKNKAPDAADRFKEANEAFQVLSDENKRAQYDSFRRYGGMGGGFQGSGMPRGGAGAGAGGGFAGTSFDDLFGSLFGRGGDPFGTGGSGGSGGTGGGFGGFGGGARRPRRGDDVVSSVRVPFDTALRGGSITIRFNRQVACETCHGSGAAPGSKVTTCSQCHGSGAVAMGGGPFTVQRPCPACGGDGRVVEKPCGTCSGRGVMQKLQEATVTIPRGVADGQTIRLAGLGHAGPEGTPPGDLLLEVLVGDKPGFRRDGRHVHSDVTVPMEAAALGTSIDVETVDGHVTLRVPPGTQPGATLRLRGRGFYQGRSDARGDHLVHVHIEIPRSLTEAQKKALEAYRDSRR